MRRKGMNVMKRSLIFAIVLSAVLIGMPAVAAATTHYVSPGDDIQAVIDTASPGDTIVFDVGTYSLSATLNVNKSLTLTSADPLAATKPIIDGGGTLDRIIYIDADDVTIDGLEVANGTGDLVRQSNSHSGTTIRNCVIHDSSGDEGIQLKACTNCLVECNVVYNVAQDGISIAGGSHNSVIRNNEIYNSYSENGAIYVYYSYDMTVEGNYIHDTQAANGVMFYKNYGSTHTIINNLIVHNRWKGGKHCYDEADGNAINIYKPRASSTYLVKHNTLDDNTPVNDCAKPGNAIYVKKSADGVVMNVDDNIVTNHNGYGIRTWSGASVDYSYNDLWQNTLGATDGNPVDGGGNISADPLYNSDYTLGGGSPCVGTASDGKDMGRLFDECECASSDGGSIGDYVWHDVNINGLQDDGASAGIANVTVNLYSSTHTYTRTTQTDSSGYYIFNSLEAGDYYVEFVLPDDYQFSPRDRGVDDEVDSDADPTTGKTITTTLESGETDLTWDAGLHLCSIGDRVWHDESGQGDQNGTEPGFNDVHVYLYSSEPITCGSSTNLITQTITISGTSQTPDGFPDGIYIFDMESLGLGPGEYWVCVDESTLPNPGAGMQWDCTTNNNPQKVTYTGADDFSIDFGYIATTGPTAVTLSSFTAKSSTGGSASRLWLGLLSLTVLAAGSLFWTKRWAG